MNKWSEQFKIPFPQCKMTGQCCRCAAPSSPAIELLEKAAEGNQFARDFLTIFIPYKNIEEAKKVNPSIVERSIKAGENPENKVPVDQIVFYHCKFISEDNKCLIHEDRPQLCRDYPDSPYLVFAPGCAYEEWSQQCREKYLALKQQLERLKEYKKELENLKYQRRAVRLLNQLERVDKQYHPAFILPSLSLVSPGRSWMRFF